MAGASQKDESDEISGINVTPFVDIALVLLIIFMVTAKYIVSQSIPVELPRAATSEPSASTAAIGISVDRSAQIFVDSRPVNEQGLLDEVRRRHSANREVRAIIAADRVVPHGRVTQVIDLVRQAGVTRFAIQTQPSTDHDRQTP